MGDSADATRLRVEKNIDSFVEGDLEHATEMLSALWKIANKDGNIPAPSNPSLVVSSLLFTSDPVLRGVLIPLIRPRRSPVPLTDPL